MTNSRNPFEPSSAVLAIDESSALSPHSREGTVLWRDGHVIVMPPGAAMPHRCVKCNQPADEPTAARRVYWYSPWLYLLLLLNILLFAVIALVLRRKAIVAPGLCAGHKARRRKVIAFAWAGSLSGLVMMYVGMATPLGIWGALLGALVTVTSIGLGMALGRIVYAARIDKSYVRLRGCGEPFLATLPPFPAERG